MRDAPDGGVAGGGVAGELIRDDPGACSSRRSCTRRLRCRCGSAGRAAAQHEREHHERGGDPDAAAG